MSLPDDYNAVSVQEELDSLQNQVSVLKQYLSLVPLAAAPLGAVDGWVAISDGTGSGFDGSSGAGLYRYASAAWVFVG